MHRHVHEIEESLCNGRTIKAISLIHSRQQPRATTPTMAPILLLLDIALGKPLFAHISNQQTSKRISINNTSHISLHQHQHQHRQYHDTTLRFSLQPYKLWAFVALHHMPSDQDDDTIVGAILGTAT
jgi:hypothetical protein